MNNFASLAAGRRSIRKFQDRDIPDEEIKEFIRIASSAPSGCNSQCWSFIAIKDKSVIKKIETAVMEKLNSILSVKAGELTEEYLTSRRKAATFFTKAPVVIAVFMTDFHFYDAIFVSALKEQGYDDKGIAALLANPDLLSVGAAVQNLLLAVHEKGYGACWTNESAIAGEEIKKILGVPEGEKFISLVPVGVPAYSPREKKMKDLDEFFSVI